MRKNKYSFKEKKVLWSISNSKTYILYTDWPVSDPRTVHKYHINVWQYSLILNNLISMQKVQLYIWENNFQQITN